MVPACREKTFVLDSSGRHDFATVHLKIVRHSGPYKYCTKIVSRAGNSMTVPVVGAEFWRPLCSIQCMTCLAFGAFCEMVRFEVLLCGNLNHGWRQRSPVPALSIIVPTCSQVPARVLAMTQMTMIVTAVTTERSAGKIRVPAC